MKELVRDTVIGHLIRWLTRGKWLPHAEELDPSLWRMYISHREIIPVLMHRYSGAAEETEEPQHRSFL